MVQPLTAMTNEQIVAELGWTRKAIQSVLGVTPTTMRPPYGDIGELRPFVILRVLITLFRQPCPRDLERHGSPSDHLDDRPRWSL